MTQLTETELAELVDLAFDRAIDLAAQAAIPGDLSGRSRQRERDAWALYRKLVAMRAAERDARLAAINEGALL